MRNKKNFIINRSKKKTPGRYFEIIGIKLCNKIPSYIINLSVNLLKENILQWLLESSDELIILYSFV